jgi:pyruvate formate lyase activating enzyme
MTRDAQHRANDNTMKGLIYNIQHYSIHDGPGIRTTVFLKGCPLRCWWCHNPESQEVGIEQVRVRRELDGKVYEINSAVGSRQSAVEVLRELQKDSVFYAESGGGVTFSGGEPMMQADFLAEILTLCEQQGIHTAIDTCGYAEPAAFLKVMDLADLFLFDIKLMDDVKHVEYTGVSNELALKNLEMISRAGKNIIIRFPVIPGITDDPENIKAVIALMQGLHLKNIDLLPYHSIAKDKYRRIGRTYLLEDMHEPNEEEMEKLREVFDLRLSTL